MTIWETDILISLVKRNKKLLENEISKKVNNLGIISDIYNDFLAIDNLLEPYKKRIARLMKESKNDK